MANPPWTDDTSMPWGAHKGVPLKDVPASYLLWLYEQKWIQDWPELHAYLKQHEELLLAERRDSGEDRSSEGYTSYEDFRSDFMGF